MRKIGLCALTLFLGGVSHAGTAAIDEAKLAVGFQRTPVWCWAACIEMCLRYDGFDVSQEEIVRRTFGAVIPTTGNWVQVTQNLNFLGTDKRGKSVLVSAAVYLGSPSAEVIINHLKRKRPIIMAFTNPATFSAHAVVVTGVEYEFVGGRARITTVTLRDPFPYNEEHVRSGGKVVVCRKRLSGLTGAIG